MAFAASTAVPLWVLFAAQHGFAEATKQQGVCAVGFDSSECASANDGEEMAGDEVLLIQGVVSGLNLQKRLEEPDAEEHKGCSALCVLGDLNKSQEIPGEENDPWSCEQVEHYVRTEAELQDCEGLIHHFAPKCCESQMGETSEIAATCSVCSGGCILKGACFHNHRGYMLTQAVCDKFDGIFCGVAAAVGSDVSADDSEGEEEEEEEEEENDDDKEQEDVKELGEPGTVEPQGEGEQAENSTHVDAALAEGGMFPGMFPTFNFHFPVFPVVYPVDEKVKSNYGCCTGGDFVHTRDRCRSGRVYMKGNHHNWLPYGWSTQSWGGDVGTTEVRWDCHARRRRCGWFGCGGTGHERTGFSPPNNGASVHYNNDAIDFYPQYCPPQNFQPPDSPQTRGCCSISDGTVDRCSSRNYIEVSVNGRRERCYKNQICEWQFDTPQSQGVRMDWYCGEHREGVRWGLYFNTLQVKFHCSGVVEWNPWWCGETTKNFLHAPTIQLTQIIGVNSGGDLVAGTGSNTPVPDSEIGGKIRNWANTNKQGICEGVSMGAFYDQLLKPSSVCWRAGMSGRSTLFPHHPDHGTKPSLLETGTFFERGEIESSPFVAAMEALSKNASLVQAAVAGNATAQELFDPFQMYCAVSGGTDCAAIGRERCTCYCVEPGTCTQVMAAKYAKAAVALLEMALDIASAVATGGTATAAKAAAKSVAKTALKNVAEKAAKTAARGAIRKAAVNAAKHFVKTASVKAMARLSKKATKELMQEWAKTALKAGMKHYLKTKVADAIKDAIWKLGCESVMNSIFDEQVTVPDWINNPSYKWGSGNGPEGFLEIADITGVVGLVGIFHEADCPTPIPGVTGDSCPR